MQFKCYRSVTVLSFLYFFYDVRQTFKIQKHVLLRPDNTDFHASEPYLRENSASGLSLIFVSTICKIRRLLDLRKMTYVSSKTIDYF